MEELILGVISRDICLPRLPWSCPVRQDRWAQPGAGGAALAFLGQIPRTVLVLALLPVPSSGSCLEDDRGQ